MSNIVIHSEDILWKFYRKSFILQGKEVEPPKSLCPYFWRSLLGMGLCLTREVRLSRLYLVALIALLMLGGMLYVFPSQMSTASLVIVMPIVLVCEVAIISTLLITVVRGARKVMEKLPFIKLVPSILGLVGMGYYAPEITRKFNLEMLLRQTWANILMVLVGALAITALTCIAFFISERSLTSHRLRKIGRAFTTIKAFMEAKKNKVCPPVTPPVDLSSQQPS